MPSVLVLDPVAKKKPDKSPVDEPLSLDGRVEFLAPLEWIEELERVAKAVGLNKSAYIRLACNRQMTEDRRARGELPGQ